jgi:hypothetical protein
MLRRRLSLLALLILPIWATAARDAPARRSPKEALRDLNDLIGSWRATGLPEGTREEQQRGFWTETLSWSWQFKGQDACLKATFEKGKYFTKGELHYLPDKNLYRFTVTTAAKENLTFEGPLKDHVLTLQREDKKTMESQKLVLRTFHGSRLLYRYEVKPQGRTLFTRVYGVSATKEGVAFAGPGDHQPECVVSGGLGTRKVTYKGETYYVCCSGCQEAFKDDPEKYIKEYKERKAKESR